LGKKVKPGKTAGRQGRVGGLARKGSEKKRKSESGALPGTGNTEVSWRNLTFGESRGQGEKKFWEKQRANGT